MQVSREVRERRIQIASQQLGILDSDVAFALRFLGPSPLETLPDSRMVLDL